MSAARWLRTWGCAAAVAVATAVRAEQLTVATYNVENYGLANRRTEDGFHANYPKPEVEKTALRAAIRALNADVLLVQEMGTAPFLDELRRDLRAEGCDYPYAFLAVGPDVDRHLALLSRRPFKRAATRVVPFAYFGGVERVKRGLLEVVIATSAGDLTIFGVHLKSRLTERPDDPESVVRRSAEATAIRDAVLGEFRDPATARFMVLGDCNDTRTSKTLLHLQSRGHTRIVTPVAAADSRGEAWTYVYHRDDAYDRIDYILVSNALLGAVTGGGATILDIPAVSVASDHRPVYVRLDL